MCLSSNNSFSTSVSNIVSNIFHPASNIIRACQSLGRHILALELDTKVFMEVLKPFIEITTPKFDVEHVHSFNIDSYQKTLEEVT